MFGIRRRRGCRAGIGSAGGNRKRGLGLERAGRGRERVGPPELNARESVAGQRRRLIPILDWLPRYDRRLLRGDLAAGVAVTAMIVPKDLGYAGIAGVPIQNGLYAAAAGAIVYALFCTSRQISTGPSSSLAAVAGGAVLATSLGGADAAQLVAGITLLTGVLFLLLAVLRMGWIAQFLSKAVVTGFLAGSAVSVTIGELSKLTGTEAEGETAWRELGSWIGGLGEIHWTTLLVGAGALAVILILRFRWPKAPGALVLVVAGLLASHLFDLGAHGVSLVGAVPRGLPAPVLPSIDVMSDHISAIAIASVALLLIGFSQTAGDARAFAARHRYRIDVNQESVAQGMANVGSGFFQGMPVSTSLSASSLNESSGARTPLASLTTGALVLATLFALAPLFSELPKAVLGAIIIDAVVFGMIDLPELRRLHRVARFDFLVAIAAVVAVLSAGVLAGVVIGVALSLGWLVYVTTRPSIPSLGREPGTQVFRDVTENPDDETFPGFAVIRPDGGLFFATAEALEDRVRELRDSTRPRLRVLVLDLEGVNFIDSQGAAKLTEIEEFVGIDGAELRLARVKPPVLAVLEAEGLIEKIGADHLHGNVDRAVEAALAAPR
ncbi:MAG: sulfate permease [Actinobacteria bacterium]|nr:sulfate permease [Actinomycetota bacterium]